MSASYFFDIGDSIYIDGGLLNTQTYRHMKKALQEREQNYLSNMEWLERDLHEKVEEKNIASHIYPVVYLHNIDVGCSPILEKSLDERINDGPLIYPRTHIPSGQIWHCGHGAARGREDESEQNKVNTNYHTEGIKNNTCVIHHGTPQHNMKGNNTYKQFTRFEEHAKKGDIIFTACSSKGGLTHWGVYSGVIVTQQQPIPHEQWYTSYISVDHWRPLSIVKRGVGRNCTLYQVLSMDRRGKPTKNYENYLEEVNEFLGDSQRNGG